ncbi:MAG: hypothetical protein V1698_00660 [bacterium]
MKQKLEFATFWQNEEHWDAFRSWFSLEKFDVIQAIFQESNDASDFLVVLPKKIAEIAWNEENTRFPKIIYKLPNPEEIFAEVGEDKILPNLPGRISRDVFGNWICELHEQILLTKWILVNHENNIKIPQGKSLRKAGDKSFDPLSELVVFDNGTIHRPIISF